MCQIALVNKARIARSVAAITLGLVASTVPPAQAEESVAERNRHFISEAFANWARGGTSFFKDVLAPEVIWTIKGSGLASGVYRGRDEFVKQAVAPFAERLASPLRPIVKDIWAERNDVVVHWGRHRRDCRRQVLQQQLCLDFPNEELACDRGDGFSRPCAL